MGEIVCFNGKAEHQRRWLSHRIVGLRRYQEKISLGLARSKRAGNPEELEFIEGGLGALGQTIEAAEEFSQRILASGKAIPEEELEGCLSSSLAPFLIRWQELKE